MLDNIDHMILQLLQEDSNLSNAALAEKVGLKASTVYERVKKLERRGVIKGYVALVLLKVRATNTQDLELIIAKIRSNATVANSVTSIVLSSFKETLKLTSDENIV